ncbi:conjugal transfer protein TraG, partial [Sphingobium sp. sgz301304]
ASARSHSKPRWHNEMGDRRKTVTSPHFLGGGAEGQAAMANWLKGGFEMDRSGNWRLKPQIADTLQRDVQAIIVQTGWSRSIARSAEDSTSMGTDIGGSISAGARRGGANQRAGKGGSSVSGGAGGSLGFVSSDRGSTTETAGATVDIVNYDVRAAIAAAEMSAGRSGSPETAFAKSLSEQILGDHGLRNRYLEQADSARGTADITGPITSIEQSSVLSSGRFSDDLAHGPFDGNPEFKQRRDK